MYSDLYMLVDEGLVSDETINVITGIWGSSESVFNDVLFYLTGYRDWEQYQEAEKY